MTCPTCRLPRRTEPDATSQPAEVCFAGGLRHCSPRTGTAGVIAGIWKRLTLTSLLLLLAINLLILIIVLSVTTLVARTLGFCREDEIPIVFCGSKKSLTSGAPMATLLFSLQTIGLILIPLIPFHQTRLMTCSWLARRYATHRKYP